MSTFVRTNHTTFSLHQISKMVAVLLLIFLPVLASANPVYQSSSNRFGNSSMMGASAMQYQPESYQMTNTSSFQVGTTYNPAQTVYAPFSDENPGSNDGPSKISNRKNNYGEGWGDAGDVTTGTETFPLGDAWSLLIFAAMAAVVIALRKKQTA